MPSISAMRASRLCYERITNLVELPQYSDEQMQCHSISMAEPGF